jgi:hypothetical protein
MSDTAILKETVGRFGASLSILLIPSPDPYVGVSCAMRNDSFMDGGAGVPVGVPVGVVFVLSTRDFRDPDLGVMLLLKNVDTDVERSSLDEPVGVALLLGRAARRGNGVGALVGVDPPTLGVKGVLFDVFAEALRVGIRGRAPAPFCLS